MVRLLLERGANPNILGDLTISPNCTPLFAADCACARILLEHGADAAARDAVGQTALFYDTFLRSGEEAEEVERVKLLLQAGTPGDALSGNGSTALFYVKETESVRLLLDHGFNPNLLREDYYTTPPIARGVNREVAQLLQRAGADVNLRYLACEFLDNWHCLDRKSPPHPSDTACM